MLAQENLGQPRRSPLRWSFRIRATSRRQARVRGLHSWRRAPAAHWPERTLWRPMSWFVRSNSYPRSESMSGQWIAFTVTPIGSVWDTGPGVFRSFSDVVSTEPNRLATTTPPGSFSIPDSGMQARSLGRAESPTACWQHSVKRSGRRPREGSRESRGARSRRVRGLYS